MNSMLSSKPVECPQALLLKARGNRRVATALVQAGGELPMRSARLASDEGLIEPVLVGDAAAIQTIAREIQWDISELRIVDAEGDTDAARRAVALARGGEVGALMKGDLHTDDLLKAVIDRELGLRTERRLSHVFHMSLPGSDDSLCITDAAINVLPDMESKLHILRNAIELQHRLGRSTPRIAVLSATETPSKAMPSSLEAADIARRAAQGEFGSAIVEGPMAFDNAVSAEAARLKGMDSQVAGQPDVLLVPNIEAGNMAFKQMVYFMSACAAGIVLGAQVPITLTSRADPAAARLASSALAAIYASA